jgi:hypothetical protein
MTEAKKTDAERLQDIGRGAYASIVEMVAALNCDYDRLEELRDMIAALDENDEARAPYDDEREELAELIEAAGDCADADEARQRITEDPLSLQVRSDWCNPGEPMVAGEYEILLSTGGPATRIYGEVERGDPISARLEAQDWFLPWTEYFDADESVLLDYARCFYFGD